MAIKQSEVMYKKPNAKSYFIRVPEEMYLAVQKISDEQRRSITLQGQILLGAAINRDLVSPELIEVEKENWYVTNKDDPRNAVVIAGPFSTSRDASLAREIIEKHNDRNNLWIERLER